MERNKRFGEAAAAEADVLTTICHACHWILDTPGTRSTVRIVNYISLVGQALGILHEDRVGKLRKTGSVDEAIKLIRQEMGARYECLPFLPEQIREAVGSVLGLPP